MQGVQSFNYLINKLLLLIIYLHIGDIHGNDDELTTVNVIGEFDGNVALCTDLR